jgi:50S ribosomal protein L16 3-hydroxylase
LQTRKIPKGLDAADFMRRFWQREPLLLRGAFPSFVDPLSPREVLALARSPDAQSRLVQRSGRRWSLEHGPFSSAKLKQLPRRGWTVLVQDTNHFSGDAQRLLAAFDFIPHARIDDLMVSYAVPGGSVGPHVDSYDVFLLQGRGTRRWRISRQARHDFIPGLPLKILERFDAEEEWLLEPGDMLYLPPNVSHHGVAETECLTWSIGFRAPSNEEVARSFLDALHDEVRVEGQYADPGAKPTPHPGEIPAAMLEHFTRTVESIRWDQATVRNFAGRFLSEPKAHVFFEPPARPLPLARFVAAARRGGLVLDLRSRLLFSGSMFFMNGDPLEAERAALPPLRRLADERELAAGLEASPAFWNAVHEWYRRGYLHIRAKEKPHA